MPDTIPHGGSHATDNSSISCYGCPLKHCLGSSESMHIYKLSFAGGFRILVDRRTPAVSARLGCGFGTRAVSDVLPWMLAAGLDTGDVVDPLGTGTGDNISGESGFGECAGLRTSEIRLVGLLGELGWAFVTCVSGSGAHVGAATKWSTCTWMILLLTFTMYATGPRAWTTIPGTHFSDPRNWRTVTWSPGRNVRICLEFWSCCYFFCTCFRRTAASWSGFSNVRRVLSCRFKNSSAGGTPVVECGVDR